MRACRDERPGTPIDGVEKLRRKKDSMTSPPNTYVMTTIAKHRREALYAEVDRERLLRLATNHGSDRRPRPSMLAAAGMVLAALAQALTGGSVVADESLPWGLSRALPVVGCGSVPLPEEHLLDPTAARQISASRL
jgi:hypothetical protein